MLRYIDSDARSSLADAIKKWKDKDDWTENWFEPSLIISLIKKGYDK
jgi:hypothetical protein